jgi:hypothetical protein
MEADEIILKDGCEILIKATVPEIYRINAFRISGLKVNSSTREITNQIQKSQMLGKYGDKSIKFDSPFPIIPAPDVDQIRNALHRLRDPETRLIDEFFWFWPHSIESDKMDFALDSLSRNDIKSAENIWINYEATLTESNVSRHNLAILSHLMALDIELNAKNLKVDELHKRDLYWTDAFKRWKLLFDHEGFWGRLMARVRQLDDPRLTTGFVRRLRESLPSAILQINAQLALTAAELGNEKEAKRHLDAIYNSGFGNEAGLTAIKRVAEPLRKRIKLICKSYADDTYSDHQSEIDASKKLIEQTKGLLKTLDILLPSDSSIREGAHDEVALRALTLVISFANKTDKWKEAIVIMEEIKLIALGESVRTRVIMNYDIFIKNLEFDQIHNTCFYCKVNKPDSGSVVEVKMHGEVQRLYSKITWKYLTVRVPRCESCRKDHNKASNSIGLGVLIGGVSGMIGCLKLEIDKGGFIAFLVLAGLGILVGYIISLSTRKTASFDSYSQFPQIVDLRKKGWASGEKPPDTN